MSVIHFDAAEFGNIVSAIAGPPSGRNSRQVDALCEALALVSLANVEAYNLTYRDETAESATTEAIRSFAPTIGNLARALADCRMLRYNCVSNGGRDCLDTIERLRALVDVQTALLQVAS